MFTRFHVCLYGCLLVLMSGCKKNHDYAKKTRSQLREEYDQSTKKTFNHKIKHLDFEEAKRALAHYEEIGNQLQQVKALERMISLAQDHTVIDALLIKLADLKFELELFEEAEALYQRYATLYPGADRIDYIKARHIESSYRQILDAARDQSITKKTIKYAKNFLQQFSMQNKYAKRVEIMIEQCYYLLLESELNLIEFYIQKFSYTQLPKLIAAAEKRLIGLNATILSNINTNTAQKVSKELTQVLDKEQKHIEDEKVALTLEEIIRFAQKLRSLTLAYRGTVKPLSRDRF